MSTRKAFIPSRPQSACFTDAEVLPARGGPASDSGLQHAASMTFGRPRSSVDGNVFRFGENRGATSVARTQAPSGGGKPLSLTGLLGKRTQINTHTSTQSETDATLHAKKPRRSFDGILRPEIIPMSIIPYPHGTASNSGLNGDATPRKQPATFSFPLSASRTVGTDRIDPQGGLDSIGEQGGHEESNGNISAGYMHMLPPGADIGVLRGIERGNTASSPSMIMAPLPGYGQLSPGSAENITNANGNMADVHEQTHPTRGAGGDHGKMDAGIAHEGRNVPVLTPGLRRERADHDPQDQDQQHTPKRFRETGEGYTPLSSPQMPAAPPLHSNDPHTTLDSLFSDLADIVNVEAFEAECKRWKECSSEEWLKGAEELSEIFQQLLDMVKDHMTERTLSFASLTKAVDDRRAEVDRDMQVLNDGMGTVAENLSCLAKKR